MEVMFKFCAGLDVHKRMIMACVLLSNAQGDTDRQIRKFGTTLAELQALAAWLSGLGVTHVAMESTGVYWKPVFNVLAPLFEVWIVNAQHIKQVPGRKTDVKDAEWIAQLMRLGLLKRSFIPEVEQRDLRDLTRYRTRLLGERASAANRLQKILEDANIKLTSVASDVQGVSARAMLEALIRGEVDAEALADLAQGKLRKKLPQLEAALAGQVREHHRFMLREVLWHLDGLNERLAALDAEIRRLTSPHEGIIQRLAGIPGIDRRTAEVILAEIGPDVTPFPTAQHLASWACLCPGNNITGGKRRSGRTRRGQNWLRAALVEAAWSASHSKASYFSSQFHRLRARRGEKRAAVAVAHSILIVVYHLLAKPEEVYQELGADFFLKRNPERERERAVRRLEGLGFSVTLAPVPAAAVVAAPS
jgi:transposase